jgi:hypothetical protein
MGNYFTAKLLIRSVLGFIITINADHGNARADGLDLPLGKTSFIK